MGGFRAKGLRWLCCLHWLCCLRLLFLINCPFVSSVTSAMFSSLDMELLL